VFVFVPLSKASSIAKTEVREREEHEVTGKDHGEQN
jgi:hypothetical protein